jgi:hypothetical protein
MSGNGIEKSCIDLKMSINASIYMCVCVIQDEKWHVGSNQLDILQTSTKSMKHAEKSLNNAAVDKAGSCGGAIRLVL